MEPAEETEVTAEEEATLSEMEKAFKSKDRGFFIRLLTRSQLSLLVRVHATCMLEDIGDEEVVPILCKILLRDMSALTRHEAAFTLGQLGYPSALDALVEALEKDPSPIVRHESAVALSSIGDARAIPHLKQAAGDLDEEVRNSAVIALKYLSFLQRKYNTQGYLDKRPKIRL